MPSGQRRSLVFVSLSIFRYLFWPLLVTLLPLALTRDIWWQVLHSGVPRAWDGTGHYAIAQLYFHTIFPDTLGWVPAYFGGMPFPNFYPPLFYWSISLLAYTNLFNFLTAFKLMVSFSTMLLPLAVWLLAYAVSDKNRIVATAAVLVSIPLLIDTRAWVGVPPGLDYYSTFEIGLYTQPLGFLLLTAWYVIYLRMRAVRSWRWALGSVLLALAVLANFFTAVMATLFVSVTLFLDLLNYWRSRTSESRNEKRSVLLGHLTSALASLGLTLFWVVPMLGSYQYFVTRPYTISLVQLISPLVWGFYAVSVLGGICWWRRPTPAIGSYLGTILLIIFGLLLAGTVSPGWFPLQPPRFFGTLNILLTVPAGFFGAALYRTIAGMFGRVESVGLAPTPPSRITVLGPSPAGMILVLVIILDAFALIKSPPTEMAFYPVDGNQTVSAILQFAQDHKDGRYLVEADLPKGADKFDGRAMNAYLGAQGNQTLSCVFHEASPNALFFLPTTNALSATPDNFGISSVLADDLDFAEQPLTQHLRRARLLGVRYLVIFSSAVKGRLGLEPEVGTRHDFGDWSIFELKVEPQPPIRSLPFRPALVLGNFTLKERHRNDYNFIRLAEEQFADGWFDVMLAYSPEARIDRLRDLNQFGALIVDTYECDSEDLAYQRLREFSERRNLILLSSTALLFKRIQANRAEFPLAQFIDRQLSGANNEVIGATIEPTFSYRATSIRSEWSAIRHALESRKFPVAATEATTRSQITQNEILLDVGSDGADDPVPVLVATTFHPNWQRQDQGSIYAVTPFYMLTFISRPVRLYYGRRLPDKIGLWLSGATLVGLLLFAGGTRFQTKAARRAAE